MKKLLLLILITIGCAQSERNKAKQYTSCIDIILKEDSRLGNIRNHACEEISLEQTIINYTDSLLGLDFSECPKPFTGAFLNHIEAWVNTIELVTPYDSIRGEMHELFDIIIADDTDSIFSNQVKVIWSTWDSIEYQRARYN